jgi:F0F1-type ATP synthase epsilon subunit
MELSIITITKKVRIAINWIEINTPVGNMVIQPHHANMIIAVLPDSICKFEHENGSVESVVVPQGIVEIGPTVICLVMHDL